MKQIEILIGYPICPTCGETLTLRPMPNYGESYWACLKCNKEYQTNNLINELNSLLEKPKELSIEMLYIIIKLQSNILCLTTSKIKTLLDKGEIGEAEDEITRLKEGIVNLDNMEQEFLHNRT